MMGLTDNLRRNRRETVLCTTVIAIVAAIYFVTGWPLWLMPILSFALTLLASLLARAVSHP